jgi:hypothetical protein
MDGNVLQGAVVAAGFEPVREEFAAVATGEGGDYSAQLVAYQHGERVVDLWTGPETRGYGNCRTSRPPRARRTTA